MEAQTPNTNSTLFKFKVDDVEPGKNTPQFTNAEAILKMKGGLSKKLEDFSHRNNKEECYVLSRLPGFMSALHIAYCYHYHLKLSVSDFILLIGQGLSKHIEKNAEKLRKHFVNHEGQEKIEIFRNEFVLGSQNDWSTVFGDFADEIKKRVKADVYGVVIDDTSVATPTSRIASEIALMDCMKQYFSHSLISLCGIPEITLEGSPGDWEKLRGKVKKLQEMNHGDCLELDWWLNDLESVVNKICDTAIKKEVDRSFWGDIYKFQSEGSGSAYISGWILTFFPYIVSGANKGFGTISTSETPGQYSEVPFIWNYYEKQIDMIFYGGFLGAKFNKEDLMVEPAHFWSVAYKETK